MKNEEIQTLIFDLGGVIINLKTEDDWIKEDLHPNFQTEKLNDLFLNNFFQQFETGKINPEDFLKALKYIAIEEHLSEEKIMQHWNGILKDIPQHRVDLLKDLSKKYQLILLSNTNHIHMDYIRQYMLLEFGEDILSTHFHTCYYSQEIGLRKPGKEIYEFVLQEQKLQPQYCVFFDDKQENLVEAQKLGIQTILVDKDISELISL